MSNCAESIYKTKMKVLQCVMMGEEHFRISLHSFETIHNMNGTVCSRRGLAPFVFQLVQPSMSEWAKYYTFNKLFHVMCYALPYLSRVDTLYGNLIQKIDVLFMTWFSNNLSGFFFFPGQTDLPLMLIAMGYNHFLKGNSQNLAGTNLCHGRKEIWRKGVGDACCLLSTRTKM